VQLTRTEQYEARVQMGDLPQRWRVLTPKMKAMIRLKARGLSDREACRQTKVDPDTYYRWRRANPLFREHLARCCAKAAEEFQSERVIHTMRSLEIVDHALNCGDAGLEYAAARDYLKGSGIYQSNHPASKSAAVPHETTTDSDDRLTDEQVKLLVDKLIANNSL
jgi:hypothetical protein